MLVSAAAFVIAFCVSFSTGAVAPYQCSSGDGNVTKLTAEPLGGRRLEQRVRLAPTAMHGCRWLLDSSAYTDYVFERDAAGGPAADACQRVRVIGGPTGGSWTVEAPSEPQLDPRLFGKCRYRLGVDCRHHLTDYQASDRACRYAGGDPTCPEAPRQVSGILGGRRFNATWIQLDLVPGNASSCAWVLLGSSASLWTLSSEATDGRACLTCSRAAQSGQISCTPPAPSAPSASNGCQHRLGPDCRVYSVDPADDTKPCRLPPSGVSSQSNSRLQDAGYRMLTSDSADNAGSKSGAVGATAAPSLMALALLLTVRR